MWRFYLFLFFGVAGADSANVIVLYHIRPPGIVASTDPLHLEGHAGYVATHALQLAGVPYELQLQSPLHQLQLVKNNEDKYCALDWYSNDERRQFALFSAPLYREAAFKIIVHRDSDLHSPVTIATLQTHYVLVRTANMSLGKAIDDLIKNNHFRAIDWVGAPDEVATVVWRKKADYALLPADEILEIWRTHPQFESDLRLLDTADFPAAPTTHMMCSRKVGNTLMQRIDAALDKVRTLN